jgi:hypothetical protein
MDERGHSYKLAQQMGAMPLEGVCRAGQAFLKSVCRGFPWYWRVDKPTFLSFVEIMKPIFLETSLK